MVFGLASDMTFANVQHTTTIAVTDSEDIAKNLALFEFYPEGLKVGFKG